MARGTLIAERRRNPKWKQAPFRVDMAKCISCDTRLRHCPPEFGAIFNHGLDVIIVPEASYTQLASRCERVIVAGLSMGGTLCTWLAARHPDIPGAVLVNPMIDPPAESFRDVLRQLLDGGTTVAPAIGSDIADPGAREL